MQLWFKGVKKQTLHRKQVSNLCSKYFHIWTFPRLMFECVTSHHNDCVLIFSHAKLVFKRKLSLFNILVVYFTCTLLHGRSKVIQIKKIINTERRKTQLTGGVFQHLVLPGTALWNYMCNCLVAVMSTQAITLLAHSKANTSDCEERVGAQEMQALVITR